MANLITTSATWTGKQILEAFIKPLFIGENPLISGIRVIPNVQSVQKLNYFDSFNKILKAYSKGFSGSNFGTMTQRSLTVYEMKAEASQDANAFYQTVYEQALNKGTAWQDMTGTVLEGIILGLFRDAVASDIWRLFWLADDDKETLVSTTYGNYSGTADTTYNAFNGMWKLIFENAATSPTSSQIKRVSFKSGDGSVAQIATLTISGSSGTATVTFMGDTYLCTFTSDLTTSAANFVTSHAATILLRGVTVTSSVADIVFTSAIEGQPFTNPTIANTTGNLTGSVASTLANTAPTALAADESLTNFIAVYDAQPAVLAAIPNNLKRIYCDTRVVSNYIEALEDGGVNTDMGKTILIDGIPRLTWRGIPIIECAWGQYLDDFPHASTYLPAYPHRVLLTLPDNLVLGIDAASEFNEMEFWYNKDEQENRFRMQLKIGVQYVHNQLMVAGY